MLSIIISQIPPPAFILVLPCYLSLLGKILFIIFNFSTQNLPKTRQMGDGEGKKCDACAAGADLLSFFVVLRKFFCSEILAWASPDPVEGGGRPGGGCQPAAFFSASSLFPAQRLDPPWGGGSLRNTLIQT